MSSRPPSNHRTNDGAAASVRRKPTGTGGRAAAKRTPAQRGRADRPVSARAAADHALAVLRADHERVAELFVRFERLKSSGPQKAQLVERICDELELHARIEEEVFYPSVRPLVGDDDLMDEALVEHESLKALIEQLRAAVPGAAQYDAKVSVLGEYVKHHVRAEEQELFPKVAAIDLDLVALGRALKGRKRQLKGEGDAQGLLGLGAFPGMMIL